MSAAKWAPDNEAGLHAYVVTTHSWGRATDRIVYAVSLAEAKRKHGWTSMQHTSVSVRRAKPEDAPTASTH